MKHRRWMIPGMALVLAAAALAAQEKGKRPPPLKIDKTAPLLLDEPAKESNPSLTGPMANNEACFVCHQNFQEESMATVHAKANIGCVKCHGQSAAHRNDEDNITPPDVMYPTSKIDRSCRKCHEEHNVSPAKVIATWQKRCPQKTVASTILCIDCHGEHRLAVRTVLWDKETGKLVKRVADGQKKSQARKESSGQ